MDQRDFGSTASSTATAIPRSGSDRGQQRRDRGLLGHVHRLPLTDDHASLLVIASLWIVGAADDHCCSSAGSNRQRPFGGDGASRIPLRPCPAADHTCAHRAGRSAAARPASSDADPRRQRQPYSRNAGISSLASASRSRTRRPRARIRGPLVLGGTHHHAVRARHQVDGATVDPRADHRVGRRQAPHAPAQPEHLPLDRPDRQTRPQQGVDPDPRSPQRPRWVTSVVTSSARTAPRGRTQPRSEYRPHARLSTAISLRAGNRAHPLDTAGSSPRISLRSKVAG